MRKRIFISLLVALLLLNIVSPTNYIHATQAQPANIPLPVIQGVIRYIAGGMAGQAAAQSSMDNNLGFSDEYINKAIDAVMDGATYFAGTQSTVDLASFIDTASNWIGDQHNDWIAKMTPAMYDIFKPLFTSAYPQNIVQIPEGTQQIIDYIGGSAYSTSVYDGRLAFVFIGAKSGYKFLLSRQTEGLEDIRSATNLRVEWFNDAHMNFSAYVSGNYRTYFTTLFMDDKSLSYTLAKYDYTYTTDAERAMRLNNILSVVGATLVKNDFVMPSPALPRLGDDYIVRVPPLSDFKVKPKGISGLPDMTAPDLVYNPANKTYTNPTTKDVYNPADTVAVVPKPRIKTNVNTGTRDVVIPANPALPMDHPLAKDRPITDATVVPVLPTAPTAPTAPSVNMPDGIYHAVTTRFPFSLPWDLYYLFSLFLADPVRPDIDIDKKFGKNSLPIKFKVDIAWMDNYIGFFRTFVMITFLWSLTLVTRKLFGGAK